MSAVIEFKYEKDESGNVSLIASMNVSGANDLEVEYAKQGMIYAHRILDTNLDDLSLPSDLSLDSRIEINTGANTADPDGGGVDDDEFDAPYGATSPEQREDDVSDEIDQKMLVGLNYAVSGNFDEIGCMNQAHNVVGKAVYDLLSEAVRTVAA